MKTLRAYYNWCWLLGHVWEPSHIHEGYFCKWCGRMR